MYNIKGKHKCTNCGTIFIWGYFSLRRQRLSSNMNVETIPSDDGIAKCYAFSADTGDVRVNCPYCDYDNHFNINDSGEEYEEVNI